MGISDVAASGFGAGADDYERGRPGYGQDLVGWLVDQLVIADGSRVVDLAAGTGKLTRALPSVGTEIIAVEPVEAMRRQLAMACPGAAVLDGTAEALPLEDSSVDAVTVGQAFHWFDPAVALAEIARVLRPGGGLGLAFYERDVAEPWVAELSKLIRWDERGRWRVPYTVETDWAQTLAHDGGGRFEVATRFDGSYRQPMDPDTLVARVLSTSYLAVLSDPQKAALAADVRALVAPLGERFDLPYVTVAYAAQRR